MKACPRCNSLHSKPGTYCSRSCANSREQTDEAKLKKSLSALNSVAVLQKNSDPDKRRTLSEKAKEQHKNGLSVLPSRESRSRGGSNSWKNRPRIYDESNKAEYRSACKLLSISDGWKLGVPAWKIAHPANCRLILHRDNASKNSRSCITPEELDSRIDEWKTFMGP